MFKKILTITLLIIVIIEIQRVECRPGESAARFGKLPPNCLQVDHLGNCVKQPSFMLNGITKKTVAPKRMKKLKDKPVGTDEPVKAETKKAWYQFW